MEIQFDERGNLTPYDIIEISIENFEKVFVTAFTEESTRHKLFENYLSYLKELQQITQKDFYQWIDGSFVSNRRNPRDIDVLTVLNFQDYESNKSKLEMEFAPAISRMKYKVDGYLVANYPENHKKHFFSKSDVLYWRELFSRTRANRAKKRFHKGIVQLNFNQNE